MMPVTSITRILAVQRMRLRAAQTQAANARLQVESASAGVQTAHAQQASQELILAQASERWRAAMSHEACTTQEGRRRLDLVQEAHALCEDRAQRLTEQEAALEQAQQMQRALQRRHLQQEQRCERWDQRLSSVRTQLERDAEDALEEDLADASSKPMVKRQTRRNERP